MAVLDTIGNMVSQHSPLLTLSAFLPTSSLPPPIHPLPLSLLHSISEYFPYLLELSTQLITLSCWWMSALVWLITWAAGHHDYENNEHSVKSNKGISSAFTVQRLYASLSENASLPRERKTTNNTDCAQPRRYKKRRTTTNSPSPLAIISTQSTSIIDAIATDKLWWEHFRLHRNPIQRQLILTIIHFNQLITVNYRNTGWHK